jgi:hypothetical protein
MDQCDDERSVVGYKWVTMKVAAKVFDGHENSYLVQVSENWLRRFLAVRADGPALVNECYEFFGEKMRDARTSVRTNGANYGDQMECGRVYCNGNGWSLEIIYDEIAYENHMAYCKTLIEEQDWEELARVSSRIALQHIEPPVLRLVHCSSSQQRAIQHN